VISRRIHKQRGRRWLTALAVIGIVSGTLGVGTAVFASTPAGQFELEGNNTSATGSGGAAPDDWDRVCYQQSVKDGLSTSAAATLCGTGDPTHAAKATAWTTDTHDALAPLGACTGTNCTIFTGGGSKDPINVDQWAWKDDAGGLPDKDNLLHGFAARYSIPSSSACPGRNANGTADTTGTTKCEMLYFGNDRFDNSGDAQQGFWFFQNKIGLGTNVVGGGNGFTTNGGTATSPEYHRLGDVLLISDFSNGGSVSTITVYTWDPGCTKVVIPKSGPVGGVSCGDANLRYQASSDSANCQPVNPATAGFCGIVTPTDGTASAWPFLDKSGNTTYLQGEMYEGGVNLSALNLGGECFASIASETRSSQSTTAVLKDFVLGSFGDCSSGIVTTPQAGNGDTITDSNSNSVADVSIGSGSVTVRDHAVVTVGGVTTWAGSVAFTLCGPLPRTPTTTNCATGGVAIPFAAGHNGNVSNSSNATNSEVTTLTSVGRYCWRATFTSSTSGVPNSTDPSATSTSTTECFEVLPVRPTLTTQASASVAVGGTVSDTGTLTGLATQPGTNGIGGGSINATNGAVAGGSISWTAFGPDDCTTVALATTSRAVSGNGTYPKIAAPASQAPVSFIANAAGTYTFVADYDGNSPNNLASSAVACTDQPSNEKVVVGSSSTVTTPKAGNGDALGDVNTNSVPDVSIGSGSVTVRDHAVVSVQSISPWAGTVAFSLCGPLALGSTTNCQTGGVSIPFAVPADGNVSNTSTSVDSPVTTLTSVGRYCWRAEFTPTTTGVPSSSDPKDATSTTECFEVLPVRPTLTTQASGDVVLGNAVSDTGTLSGLATQPGTNGIGTDGSINANNGAAAGGSLTFTAYGPDDCTTVAMAATSRAVSGNGTYPKTAAPASQPTVGFVPTGLGTYTFVASYGGNSPNNLASTPVACTDQPTAEKVTVTGTSSLTTAQDWLPNDTATVTGDATLNGSVTFQLYTGDNCGATSGAAVTGQSYTRTITNGDKAGASVSTANTTKLVKAADGSKWSWLVSYDDNVLSDPAPTCESTTITINN
jgi:hypothetical protein